MYCNPNSANISHRMRYSTSLIAGAAVLAGSAIAAPHGPPSHGGPWNFGGTNDYYCLSANDAYDAASIFQELIQDYSDELALATLTPDFVDYSSAVSIIINGGDDEPLDIVAPTFVGRQEFMDAQGSQPKIPFQKLNIFHGCDSVSMRWWTKRSAKGQETEVDNIVSSSPLTKFNTT